ncbi:MAG: endolytic transglycosylase MltG [Caldimicrobium sp.]|nr:endolytic transglycosylase MltG [Caldimicrobium sp.]MCX7874478.1 endolytic transglycosylase MltG [Caldimicrobium sp.]MDW8094085.1 endolytic transglycosylase MltG [Caldimicrobium sp.]
MKFSRDKKVLGFLLLIFHIFLFTGLYIEGIEPASSDKRALPKIVEIERGESLLSIASKLKKEGLIRSSSVFVLEALRRGVYRDFKAGEYALYPYQSLSEIFEILIKGKVYLHRITIPEGATLWQIAEALEREKICSKEEFIKWAENPDFISELGLPGPTAEGYLFPETYFFAKKTPPPLIIKVMTNKFKEIWQELEDLAIKRGLSLKEVVILASIVEKEAFHESEKPIIAGVYFNRLKRGMPLQADPTINYALKTFRRLTYKDYHSVKSPYNTYLNPGLPPTPIGNPGKSSLLAVLKPAKVPYLYFVATPEKKHIFSRTYKEHLTAIYKIRNSLKIETFKMENSTSLSYEKFSINETLSIADRDLKPL